MLALLSPTSRQREVLRCLYRFQLLRGYPPTQRELAKALSCSVNAIASRLRYLQLKGYVDWTDGDHRGVILTGISWLPRFEESMAGQRWREALQKE